jgi:hypothetical protein
MKLLLRRNQKSGVLGKVTFTLDVRVELSEEERAHIRKYKLADTILYQRDDQKDAPVEYHSNVWKALRMLAGVVSSIFKYRLMNVIVLVKDLENGKHIEVKDVLEMLAVEAQLRQAAQTFKHILAAAAQFGGEEIVDIA